MEKSGRISYRDTKFFRLTRELGIAHEKRFLDKSKTTSFDRLPISLGSSPDNELLVIILTEETAVMSLQDGESIGPACFNAKS